MTFRRLVVALSFLLLTATGVPVSSGAADADLAAVACSLPHEWLLRTWRGWSSDHGGNVQILAAEPNFVGSGLPHVGPWPYVQNVPMFWYGPGYIRAQGSVKRPVTSAGIAPTEAKLLGFPFAAPDGSPMTEALIPAAERANPDPPKLIVTLVWDAGGINVLEAHADAWPYLKSLIPKGTWYEHGTVGSSPTSTAQIHANIGTGAFPDHHGLVGHRLRIGEQITTPWAQGPNLIVRPTLADLYDRAMGNEPKIGIIATVNIHFGMMGHGAFFSGGDKDIAMTRSVTNGNTLTDEGFEWNLPSNIKRYYTLPPYLKDVPGFQKDVEAVDAADGQRDGKWRTNDIDQLLGGFDTPARTPYQERVLETVIQREGFGADGVPDLMYANFKEIDYISHIWTMNSLEMRDAVVAQDRALKSMVGFLNAEVGRGNWVLGLTADHGAIPDPKLSGAFQISTTPIGAGINEAFDHDGDDVQVVELIQPTQLFVDEAELRQNGGTLEEVAGWIMDLTEGDTAPPGVQVPAAEVGEKVFQAAFPSELMNSLDCLPEATG
ncbi:MAG TPA: alkaline phosphatase family protein [Actinomycetota bacterium]|nr:alkaline phosphatase family protein [Actinomycetota bacterium]